MSSVTSMRRRDSRGGFTLIELLAVVLIIGVLAALILGSMHGIMYEGERVKCAQNLRQLGVATMSFTSDNNGYLPPGDRTVGTGVGNFVTLLSAYTSPMKSATMAADVFYCPTNVRLGSPPAGGFKSPVPGYKGYSGYYTNYLINESIFLVTNGSPSASNYTAVGQIRMASVLSPSQTVALSDIATRPASSTAPPVSGLDAASYFNPASGSGFFLGLIHNKIGNVLFLDGHVGSFDGSSIIAAKSLPTQTTVW